MSLERPGRSPYLKRMATLAGGTAAGQIVIIAVTLIVLPRLYSETELGVLSVYAGTLATIGVAASLRYEFAIPLPDDEEQASNVLWLSLGLVAGLSVVVTAAFLLLGDAFTDLTDATALRDWLWLFPAGFLAMGAYQALNYWAIRRHDYGRIARTKIVQAVAMVATQVGFGVAGAGPVGLVAGDIAGRGGGSGSLALAARRSVPAITRPTLEGLRAVAVRYRRFPVFSTPSAIVNAGGLQLPAVVFASTFDVATAGLFFLAQRATALPMALVGQAVAQVYLGEASRIGETDQRRALFVKTARGLAAVALPTALVVALAAPWAVDLVLPSSFSPVGEYARIMAPLIFAQLIMSPLSHTLIVTERQDLQLAWDVTRLVLSLGAIVVAGAIGLTAAGAVAWFAGAMVLAYAILFGLCLFVLRP